MGIANSTSIQHRGLICLISRPSAPAIDITTRPLVSDVESPSEAHVQPLRTARLLGPSRQLCTNSRRPAWKRASADSCLSFLRRIDPATPAPRDLA